MLYMIYNAEGNYVVMNVHDLPSNMWLAYIGDPSDSG